MPINELDLDWAAVMSADSDTPPLNRRRSAGAILVPLAIVIGLVVVGVYVVRDVQHHGIDLPGSSSGKLAGNVLTKKVDGFNTTINALAVQAQLAQALDHSTTNYVQRISCSLQASSGKGSNATHDRYICVVAYFKGPQRRWCATFDSYHSELAGYSRNTRLCNRAWRCSRSNRDQDLAIEDAASGR